MRQSRIYFFNRFFWPDNSATAQILTDLCRGLEPQMPAITVVTSRLNYEDPTVVFPSREHLGSIEIRRLWSTRFGRSSLPGRLMDYLTIYLSFFLFALLRVGRADVAVFKTDPPMLSVPGALARLFRRYTLVAWCQDVFPEVATCMGRPGRLAGMAIALLAWVRDWSLRRCGAVVALGQDMERFLTSRGIDKARLHIIPNWSVHPYQALSTPEALRRQWGIGESTFVVGYSGNLGRAHDWRTVLEAARMLRNETDLLFLVCGGGHGYGQLQEAVVQEQLVERFLFLPYQPQAELAASLRVPDLHWFTLMEGLTPFIFPSKFYGILEAGRPVLFIGQVDSAIAEDIEQHQLGSSLRPGDATGLVAAIQRFRGNPEGCLQAGHAARSLWEHAFGRDLQIRRWRKLLAGQAQGSREALS